MRRDPDFTKCEGMIPAIVQDDATLEVLMLGYMNQEAYASTKQSGQVTFFSRSKGRLWTKGETSGNFLHVKEIRCDCDSDAILIRAIPAGPTCHEGTDSCFGESERSSLAFLGALSRTIGARKSVADAANSYTAQLFAKGIDAIAQKVGEEAIEVVIEAKNSNDERLLSESADLLYHLMVLLEARGVSLTEVAKTLKERQRR
jgi:phosphoribosyl-ATP pyrophosphohydrolase/phosphoribosyl-AMP cyclohydrolase